MSDHLPVLKVRLFGGFSASYGEIPVSFGRNTTTKAMKLLQILLYYSTMAIPVSPEISFLMNYTEEKNLPMLPTTFG
ncbi:hypothetical protein [Coprococcus comes]|uniref:hypothetical protein n=1 Tax=Coprococcus comes TaxID=410072 RepID=UPI001FB8BDAF|nr:hypothetical protein [Coprococcus comes]